MRLDAPLRPSGACNPWNGVVHFHAQQYLLGSKGRALWESTDGGKSWEPMLRLPVSGLAAVKSWHRLFRRFFRGGVHQILAATPTTFVVFSDNRSYDICCRSRRVVCVSEPIIGSRPLIACVHDGRVFYGEYRSNPERSPVHVFSRIVGEPTWGLACRFDQIRHVHGIFPGPTPGRLLATTGDHNHECGIWDIDLDSQTVERLAGGSQQFRAVQILPTDKHLYFATDAPGETNAIYRIDRQTRHVAKLARVTGPVFYGAANQCGLFFGTVVEPSTVNTDQFSRVYWSAEGESWKEVASFKKDVLPKKLFQYGQTRFPTGPGDKGICWLSPFATDYDQQSLCLRLDAE